MSRSWLDEHRRDPYVKRARQTGYRSRAAYKLLELNQRDRLVRAGMVVVDLGASPGGWSQVAKELVGPTGRVIATDILAMEPLVGVEFLQGDIRDPEMCARIVQSAGGLIDLVISDMAPNLSGVKGVDQARSAELAEIACDFARSNLKPGGDLLVKIFHGADLAPLVTQLRGAFRSVVHRKPAASRARSSEVYVLARGFVL
jgi:23S rRNA (uridine2552-2'-O)-methyltransferase